MITVDGLLIVPKPVRPPSAPPPDRRPPGRPPGPVAPPSPPADPPRLILCRREDTMPSPMDLVIRRHESTRVIA